MSIKTGDLCFVIRPFTFDPNSLGMVVEVLQVEALYAFPSGNKPGAYVRTTRKLLDQVGRLSNEGWCKQDALRPIRYPGDDAQDESLQWLPVPSREKETA